MHLDWDIVDQGSDLATEFCAQWTLAVPLAVVYVVGIACALSIGMGAASLSLGSIAGPFGVALCLCIRFARKPRGGVVPT